MGYIRENIQYLVIVQWIVIFILYQKIKYLKCVSSYNTTNALSISAKAAAEGDATTLEAVEPELNLVSSGSCSTEIDYKNSFSQGFPEFSYPPEENSFIMLDKNGDLVQYPVKKLKTSLENARCVMNGAIKAALISRGPKGNTGPKGDTIRGHTGHQGPTGSSGKCVK